MCPKVITGPTPVYRRVMIFIDGGYLRQTFEEIYKHQDINWAGLLQLLVNELGREEKRRAEVIRAYYYDAIVDIRKYPEEFKEQDEYFSKIRELALYEVRLARIKKSTKEKKKQKQKGADVLLAVGMLTKALLDHYEIAILLTGDDDFLDLVDTIKDFTDKRVYGAFFPNHISDDLRNSYDKKLLLSGKLLEDYGIEKKRERKE